MYHKPYFKEKDEKEILQFMQQHPFVILCGSDRNGVPEATHIPILIDQRNDKLFLIGHISRKSSHHKAFEANSNVLVIFTGPHSYVSASWYDDPQQASTWNYMTVHAKGRLRFLDESSLLNILKQTTSHFEKSSNSPALFEKLPADYVASLSNAIIGFEIEVSTLENVFKLSQNRNEQSFDNIIAHLNDQDIEAKQVASEMLKRKSQIFSS